MCNKVFISYAKEDIKSAEELFDFLASHGYDPWMDKKKIRAGQDWRTMIMSALKKTDFIILLFSEISVSKQGFVQREYKLALDYCEEKLDTDSFLIPCKVDDCEIPEKFCRFQWVELNKPDSFKQILNALDDQQRKVLEKETPVLKSNQVNNYIFNLSETYEIVDDRDKQTAQLINLCDDIKDNNEFKLSFNIKTLTELYEEYNILNRKENLNDLETKRKISLRTMLDYSYYIHGSDITKIMGFGINFIISNYFISENKLINHYDNLYYCIENYLKLFNKDKSYKIGSGSTVFDICNDKLNYSFNIHIEKTELDHLLKAAGTDDKYILTRNFGLYTMDFNLETIVTKVFPKVAYILAIDHFDKKRFLKHEDEFLKILNWPIGIG